MPSEVVQKLTLFGYTYIHVVSSGRYRKHALGGAYHIHEHTNAFGMALKQIWYKV